MSHHHSFSQLKRRLQCETLEPRFALNGDMNILQNAQSLTLSFVPDGTAVSGQESALASKFAAAVPNWQEVIVRAFQTWASQASITIGVVADGGQPLGIQGSAHLDNRFGDIRIAGVPLSLDTYGEAIHETRTIVGTWSGDIVLNTSAPIASEAELFSVALHEAGHVLGLEHSVDPFSPMFKHGISQTAGPTAADIAALQAIYGSRRLDVHDSAQRNETIQRATRIRHAEAIDGYTGATPLATYGDVQNANDKDVYELPVLPGYSGALTIELVTRGISELAGRLTVMDRDGVMLGQILTAGNLGDKVSMHLSSVNPGKLYLQVESAGSGLFSSGSYGLVTKYDQLLTTPPAIIDAIVLQGFHWQARTDDSHGQVDIRKLLASGTPQLNDDQHQDDSVSNAIILKETVDTTAVRKFQVVGTITDATDVDSYRVRSQNSPSAIRGLTVTVESWERNGLIPSLVIFDKTGAVMPVTIIVNGNGQLTLRAEGIEQNKDYFIQLTGRAGSQGNYSLVASFDDVELSRTALFAGQLTAATPVLSSALYVARPQLFSFAMASQTAAAPAAAATIWTTVIDAANRNVSFLGSAVGEFRSGTAVLLEPGTYSIIVEGRDASGDINPNANFTLYADRVSDPVGPQIIDVGTQPAFTCTDLSGLFCFPRLPPTSDPVGSTPPTVPPVVPPGAVGVPVDSWYWGTDFLPTNPIEPRDTNGDGLIGAFDVLGVINFLNQFGATVDPLGPRMTSHLDVNGDGVISAFDALLVINFLNLHPTGSQSSGGEASAGEAVISPDEYTLLLITMAEEVLPNSSRRGAKR